MPSLPPPEYFSNLDLHRLEEGVLAFFGVAGGVGFIGSTAVFLYNGLYGTPEAMNHAGSIMYLSGLVGSTALYGLRDIIKRNDS